MIENTLALLMLVMGIVLIAVTTKLVDAIGRLLTPAGSAFRYLDCETGRDSTTTRSPEALNLVGSGTSEGAPGP